jgi:hypothetical protein
MFKTALPLAREFILRNARLLDRRIFAALFEAAPIEPVLTALRAYQNLDGGFGSCLEADIRAPISQPIQVEQAFMVLDQIGAFAGPMVAQACDYLQTITTPAGGVPFAVKGIEDYPRAPWWEPSVIASLNPTASLAGLLLKHGINHPWVERASAFCRREIEAFAGCEYHTVMPIVTFLAHTPDRPWAKAQLERILTRLPASGAIALDPAASGYAQFPLDWAPQPSSPLRPLFDRATITLHLRALATRQQPDGGWPITWTAVGPGAEYEWRGRGTVLALLALRENE